MNKKRLEKLLATKEQRKTELVNKSKTSTDVIELRGINAELESLNGEIAELRGIIAEMPDEPAALPTEQRSATSIPANPTPKEAATAEQRAQMIGQVQRGAGTIISNPLVANPEARGIDTVFSMPTATPEQTAEMRHALFSAAEYRTGFFKVLAGRTDLTDTEKRALTTASNSGGAAVPTTTYDLIIKRMQQTSALFGLINKTYLPGNVVLPVANAQTAAQWSDTAPGTDQDDTLSQVSLGAFALSKFAKVKGQLILMAIDALETYIVSAVGDQLAIAVENSILNGTGSSQPTGILAGVTFDSTNSATYTASLGYDDMVDAKKLLGLYRANAVWVCNANMEAQIYKIKTTVNQPLFTQNPITGLIANPLGFPLVVDYYMPDDTILLMNPDYYYMNINQNPTITADDSAGFLSTSRVYRGTMFLDGKPALSDAFVKLTKAAG
ncbi:MAG: phage major capsid protein [Ethanoligenens sp.]